jgi:hypothetical protein
VSKSPAGFISEDNRVMRSFLFWYAILGPKARIGFLILLGLCIYAVCRA